MTGRRLRAAALAALAAAAFLFPAAGCGRKAKPEPRTASRTDDRTSPKQPIEERTCTISR